MVGTSLEDALNRYNLAAYRVFLRDLKMVEAAGWKFIRLEEKEPLRIILQQLRANSSTGTVVPVMVVRKNTAACPRGGRGRRGTQKKKKITGAKTVAVVEGEEDLGERPVVAVLLGKMEKIVTGLETISQKAQNFAGAQQGGTGAQNQTQIQNQNQNHATQNQFPQNNQFKIKINIKIKIKIKININFIKIKINIRIKIIIKIKIKIFGGEEISKEEEEEIFKVEGEIFKAKAIFKGAKVIFREAQTIFKARKFSRRRQRKFWWGKRKFYGVPFQSVPSPRVPQGAQISGSQIGHCFCDRQLLQPTKNVWSFMTRKSAQGRRGDAIEGCRKVPHLLVSQ